MCRRPPADSLPNAVFVDDPNVISDKRLDSPDLHVVQFPGTSWLTFRQNFNLETGFDGGVLEISSNGEAFQDILAAGGSFITGGYNSTISTQFGSAIAGRPAWSGNSGGFITTTVNLPRSGTIVLRWRMGSDAGGASQGWRVDNILITECPEPPPKTPTPPPPSPTPTPPTTHRQRQPPCSDPSTLLSEAFDGVTPPALPTGWSATNAQGPAPLWVTSDSGVPAPPADSLPNAAFVDDPNMISDKRLDSPDLHPFAGILGTTWLTFRHNFNLETGDDGGVLEISSNGGAFQDVIAAGGSFIAGGYNATISTQFGSPIAGRPAWTGIIGGFITTTVNLPRSSTIALRWRMGSDAGVAAQGWRVDNVLVTECLEPPPNTPTPPFPHRLLRPRRQRQQPRRQLHQHLREP